MREVVDIIVNVLSNTPNGKSVKFTKVDNTTFKFNGEGTDGAGTGYNYSIDVKYTPKKSEVKKDGNN